MKIKLRSLYLWALYLALIGQCCALVGRPLQITALGSIGTLLVAGSSMLSFVLLFFDSFQDNQENRGFALLLLTVFAVLGGFIVSMQYRYSSVVSVLMFLQIPVFLTVASRIHNRKAVDMVYWANAMQAMLFFAFFCSGFSHRYIAVYGETVHENLTLGYGNPNEAGIYLLMNGIMLLSGSFHYHDKRRYLFWTEFIGIGYLICLTESRIVILMMLFVLVCTLGLRTFMLKRATRMLVMMLPALFILFSFFLPNLTILGEMLDTGRSTIYQNTISNMDRFSFFFGDLARFQLQNLHNAYLSIFASLGVFVFTLFVVLLSRSLKRVSMIRAEGKDQRALLFGFLAVIIHGSVEAALLTSGTVYSVSVYLLYFTLLEKMKE